MHLPVDQCRPIDETTGPQMPQMMRKRHQLQMRCLQLRQTQGHRPDSTETLEGALSSAQSLERS